jgi:hypothetical protein
MDGKQLISIQDVTAKILPYASLRLIKINGLAVSQEPSGHPLPRLNIKLIRALSYLILLKN